MWGLPQRQGSIHWSTFDVSRQLIEQGEACLVRRIPRPRAWWFAGRDEACLLVVVLLYALRPLPRPRARWLAARGENFTTPSVYSSSLLRTLVSPPSIYLYKATIKNTFCIYTRPQIVIETKVTTPSFPVYGSISKSLQPRQTVSGGINFVVCTVNQYARFSQEVMFTEALIRTNA